MDWGWMNWITPTLLEIPNTPVAELPLFQPEIIKQPTPVDSSTLQNGIYSKGCPDIRQEEGESQRLLCNALLLNLELF